MAFFNDPLISESEDHYLYAKIFCIMKRLVSYLIQGLLYIAPITITVYVLYASFEFIDNLMKTLLEKLMIKSFPGLGAIIIILLLILIGFLGQTIIAKPLKILFRRMLEKIPLLKFIYSAFNDLLSAFVGKEKKFSQPVLVLVNPISNLEKLGFITKEDLTALNIKDKVAVYFPHSYNFSGELFIVPVANVKAIDINPREVMKFIVSGGISSWDDAL